MVPSLEIRCGILAASSFAMTALASSGGRFENRTPYDSGRRRTPPKMPPATRIPRSTIPMIARLTGL